jgi:hypothetical protein
MISGMMGKDLSRKWLLTLLLLLGGLLTDVHAQGVGIGTTSPNASALLELQSTDKGLLIPRLTRTQKLAVASPQLGVLIYQTDSVSATEPNTFYYWDGTVWQPFIAKSDGWMLLGNAGTVASTNFIGTTDNKSWHVKTNNTDRLFVKSTGEVGVNTITPTQQLEVANGNVLLSNANNTASDLRFQEASTSGSNFSSFKARAQTADIAYQLPDTQGRARDVLSNDGTGKLYWSPNCQIIDYQPTTLITFNANQDSVYLDPNYTIFRVCATASNQFELRGFRGGTNGRLVMVCNIGCQGCSCGKGNLKVMHNYYTGTAAAYNIIISTNNFSLGERQAMILIYDGASSRWRIVGKTP